MPKGDLDQSVYYSLRNYEKQIGALKIQAQLLHSDLEHYKRLAALYQMMDHSKEMQQYEPYTEEELESLDAMLQADTARRPIELSESITYKTDIEQREQDEFMATMKDQYFEDHSLALRGAS